MSDLEQQLHYPWADALPGPGATLQVAAGIYWIRMALPFALDHINLWLLADEFEGRRGWTVVDCCISHPAAKAQWETLFAQAFEGLPLLRVIVTHMHPDHVGLAHWLCERWDAPLWISATEYHVAQLNTHSSSGNGGEAAARFFAQHGLRDPEALEQISQRRNYYASLVPALPSQYRRLMDGQLIGIGGTDWRCISGYGHSPEHMALYSPERKLLVGGDMMLPRISTNVSVFETEPESNPLQLFLQSIDKFLALPSDTLTLPSHGKPFVGLQRRVAQLHEHHRERLSEVQLACEQDACSAADVLPVLFKRQLDLHQTTFAMGEAIAHLHALWFAHKVRRETDAQGVYRFRVQPA